MNGPCIERRIETLPNAGGGQGRQPPLDARVNDVRPVPLYAHQRRSHRLAERVVRVLPAGSDGVGHLFVAGIVSVRRVDLRKSHAQPAAPGKQHRQVRRIDLRQVRQHVQQPAQSSRDRPVHPLPHDGLSLWIGVGISLVVQNLDQSDLRVVEALHDAERVIVAALVHLVALERRPDEDRDDEFALGTRHLHHGKHRACAGALPAGADDDHDRVPAQERFDFGSRFLERLCGHAGVVSGSQAARCPLADDHALFPGNAGQRELVGVQESGRDRASQTVRELAVRLLRHRQVAVEQLFGGTQDVAAASTQTQKQDIHWRPFCSGRILKSQAMTTHLP